MRDEFQLTQEDIADAVGKDRASVANFLRLLKLPAGSARRRRGAATLSMGHARALLALADEADQRRVARDVIARSLSVRETEALVKKSDRMPPPTSKPAAPQSTCIRARPRIGCSLPLGTRVRIVRQRHSAGAIEIDFGPKTN